MQNEKLIKVTVNSGLPQCKVDVDGAPEGMTDSAGTLTIQGIEAGDHYLHVQCPGRLEVSHFMAPHSGEKVEVNIKPTVAGEPSAGISLPDAVTSEARLHRIVGQAVQARASGEFQKTVKLFREATVLDPENSDLHRELGITFLLAHNWERARVEVLEAIRHDPASAEAHSGLAYAYEKLGNLEEALKEYRICTHLDPGDASYQRHYVEVLGAIATQQAQRKH